ncbi:hypothetical protein N9V25_00090 [Flavobacteriaceae bacterium]|jgi:hypothetical protein|nr:hypothetical protein [Flavobacteriaceae bacterium]MDB2327448.1 hypothetical protein [Flavobacteriaceae bacterium]
MALINRQTLKNYFQKGGFATEKHFVDLIDSSLNMIDDGISINQKQGFKLNPIGFSTRLMSFFKKATQNEPDFTVNINQDNVEGLSINNREGDPLLKFDQNKQIGVHTNEPRFDFDVRGVLGIDSKSGNHIVGEVDGDGSWQTIISNLDGINGFEVVASIRGKMGSGRYAMAHAIALSTFGGKSSRNRIKNTHAYYGSFMNRLSFRWVGEMHNYELQVRTRRHYGVSELDGQPYKIKFNVSRFFSE